MRLFWYYALHAFKNQLKKLFKTWVLIFLVACMLIGGLIGFGIATLEDVAEEQNAGVEDTVDWDGPDEPDEPGALEAMGVGKFELTELIAGAIVLAVFAIEAIGADKNGSKIFLPADVNLLFSSPMKPQSVLAFRLMMQVGTLVIATLYMLFQLPNLTLNLGLDLWSALALIATWGFTIVLAKLMQVLLYLLCSTHPRLKENLSRVVYALLGLAAAGYFVYWKLSGLPALAAAVRFWCGMPSRAVPVWGWIKGFAMYAVEGSTTGVLCCFAGVVLAGAVLVWAIGRVKADFYEDAMAKSEETAELLARAQEEKSGLIVRRRKKDRSERLRRGEMKRGWGANVFLHKALYNRFRFAHLGFFTKTMETYLFIALGMSLLCRFVIQTRALAPAALAIGVAVFYRTLGNPLTQDTKMDFFLLIPESTWAKLFYSLLGGTANCLLDVLPAMLLGTLLLGAGLVEALGWVLLIVSVDFYATTVATFIDLSTPVSAGKTVKQLVQIMFIYFGLLPDIGIIAVGMVLGETATAALIATAVNAVLGLAFFALCPLFLEKRDKRRAAPAGENTVDLRRAKRHFSRLGFGCVAILAIGSALQLALASLLTPWQDAGWYLWVVSFVPLYCVAVPVGLLILRGAPKGETQKLRSLRAGEYGACFLISIGVMYTSNLIGSLLLALLSDAAGATPVNPLETYVQTPSLVLQVLFMVVLAPMIEEFIFRRMLIDRMRPYGEKLAVVTSALMFALFHGNLSQFFYAFALGAVFGCVYLITGKLRYTIGLHMFVNFIGSVLGPWIIERTDPEVFAMDDLSQLGAALSQGAAGLLIYLLALVLLTILGLVLLVVYARRVRFETAPMELPRGRRFSTAWLNAGMILLTLACLASIVITFLL